MDIVKREDTFAVAVMEMEQTKKMAEMLMKTPHYAKMGAEGIYAVLAKARSMDIDPMEALNGALYYVNGRVGMSTEAMAARMRAAGHSIQKDSQKSSPTCCVLIGKRADNGDQWETSFSVEDAKRAGIYNDRGPWGKYPSVMCYNRAMSQMFRQLTPDLSKGAGYTLDELKEIAGVEMPAQAPKVVIPASCVETISEEQAMELTAVFQRCAPEYVEQVWQTLRKPPIAITDIKDLPVTLFERIKGAAVRKGDEYQATMASAEEEMETETFAEMEA